MPLAKGIPQCHHVRTNGVRCGSPAMRGRSLCFFHTRVSAKPNPRPTGMPSLEDGNAIQLGIAEIIRRVLIYDIDYRAAYVLLHAYKLALWNLKNVRNDPYYKEVVTVDPASDPENAGTMTEPLTHHQITALENPEPEIEKATIAAPEPKDQNTTFREFLESYLVAPEATTEPTAKPATPTHDRAPSNRSGFERTGGASEENGHNQALSSRAKPRDLAVDSESEGRHYLAQHVSAGKEGNAPSPAGTAPNRTDKRAVQRITIPKELSEAINNDPEPEMTEEQFMRLTSALFNTKTG